MQEKLIIYMHATRLERPSWMLLSEEGRVQKLILKGEGNALRELAKDREVRVWVPSEDVLITKVNLPKMTHARLVQALPFALEEELAQEVELLHFVAGEPHSSGTLPVAIVSIEKMQSWLALLHDWHIKPHAMHSSLFALPWFEKKWKVLVEENILVRTGQWEGFACEISYFNEILQLAFVTSSFVPEEIIVENYTESRVAPQISTLVPIRENMQPPHDLPLFFSQPASEVPFNLLQGPFAFKKSKRHSEEGRYLKRLIQLSSIFCLSLLFIGPAVSNFILHQRVKELSQHIAEIYYTHFPHSAAMIAPKLRLEQKLQKLVSKTGDNQVLILLGQLSHAMTQVKHIKFNRLVYLNHQITLTLTALTPEDFSQFTRFLQQQGLKVTQQNTDLSGSHIQASLLIE